MKFPLRRGPWTTLASKIVYQNPWMIVREDAVTRPDGKPGIYGVITMPIGICVLPIDADNFVYLVKQYRYGVERETIEAIAGSSEGKDITLSARRELREETGIEAATLTPLGTIDPFTSMLNVPEHLFLATGLTFGTPNREETELDMRLVKVPYGQALKWVMDGTITHGASVVAILKARDLILGDKS